MTSSTTLGLAIGLALVPCSFALAQQGNPAVKRPPGGGSGTHQSAQKTGSVENTEKVIRNQNGYRGLYAYGGRYRHHYHHHHWYSR